MTEPIRNILILEDDAFVSNQIVQSLAKSLPELKVMVARTLAEAHTLMGGYEFEMYIVDINLPDGNGLDFLSDVKTGYPEAHTIVLTSVPLRQFRRRAEEIGVTRFLEKPFDMLSFAELVRCVLDPGNVTEQAHFNVNLKGLNLVEIIEMKCLSRSGAILEILEPSGQRGLVSFRDGDIVHAQTLVTQGIPALTEILTWKGGSVNELDSNMEEIPTTITVSWQHALLQALQNLDEKTAA